MDDKVSELLEQVRQAAISLGQTAGTAAQAAGKKAEQMADVAKLNLKIFDLKSDIDGLLKQMGQIMYDTHQGKEAPADALNDMLAQVDAKHAQIAEERGRINALRNSKPCPKCGAACGQEDKFCKACGAELGQI